MSERTMVVTPVVRIINGNYIQGETTDRDGNPYPERNGEPGRKYWLWFGIEKANPGLQAVVTAIQNEAAGYFRNGEHLRPDFCWKFFDGDIDKHGQQVAADAPTRGMWIFRTESCFKPTIVKEQGGIHVETTEIKNGDYAIIQIGVAAHAHPKNNSMFLNLNMIKFFGLGAALSSRPDPSKVFSQPVAYVPAGCTVTSGAPAPQQQPPAMQQQYTPTPQGMPVQQQYTPTPQQPPATGLPNQIAGQNFTGKI